MKLLVVLSIIVIGVSGIFLLNQVDQLMLIFFG
jgi:hypothetical protein